MLGIGYIVAFAFLGVPMSTGQTFDPSLPHTPMSQGVRVPGGVMQRLVMKKVPILYPEEARRAHANGVMVLHVLVDTAGRPHDISIIRGPEQLRQAVVACVQQWRWRPYLRNGMAVDVDTVVTINLQAGE